MGLAEDETGDPVSTTFDCDGMALWYDVIETPALTGSDEPGGGFTLTVGVRPVDASNWVTVDYRVNKGPLQSVAAEWLRTDQAENAHYFRATFPRFQPGDAVSYIAICRCAGRQVP